MSGKEEKKRAKKKKPYPEPSDSVKHETVYPMPASYAKYESLEHLTIAKARRITEQKDSEEKSSA